MDVAANVCSAVINAMAGQIDGLTKDSKKRRLGPRLNNPKKIDMLFQKMDGAWLLFNLADYAK